MISKNKINFGLVIKHRHLLFIISSTAHNSRAENFYFGSDLQKHKGRHFPYNVQYLWLRINGLEKLY